MRLPPPVSQDEELLGQLAMQFRGARRDEERQAVARLYSEAVDRLIRSGAWAEAPAPEDELPDEWMPKAFFEYWSGGGPGSGTPRAGQAGSPSRENPQVGDGGRESGLAAANEERPQADATAAISSDFDWTGWSPWTSLTALELESVPSGPGAYIIAADRPINRAVGVDEEGFLDVGESGSLRKRLRAFKRCTASRDEVGHMAGWRYAFFGFEQHFPLPSLRVRFRATESKRVASRLESRVLRRYLSRHLELPPLNYKFNWDDHRNDRG